MNALLSKMRSSARTAAMRLGVDEARIRFMQKKKVDVLKDGKWLYNLIEIDTKMPCPFSRYIDQTNLRAWHVRPVDTWKREWELEQIMDRHRFGFESILIVRDPYGMSPLSALLLFETEEECYVRYTVRGKTPACDFSRMTEKCVSRHRVPVFGLYASYENKVDVELVNRGGEVIGQKQIQIPVGMVSIKLGRMVKSLRKNEDTGMPFVFVTGGYKSRTYAFDVQGDIRFLLTKTPRQYGVYPLPDGGFLFTDKNINRPTFNNPHALVLYDMDYLGRSRETYYVKEGLHHWAEVVPGTDGKRILGGSSSLEKGLMEGTLLEFDRGTGETVAMYDLGDYFPQKLQNKYDWAHLNRVFCQDGRYVILSLRNVSTVVKMDMAEKRIVWVLSHPNVYKNTELEELVLRPVGEDFHYFLQQHAVETTDTGLSDDENVIELMLFDNHCNTKRKVKWFDGKTESYACFYRIDEKAFTVETTKAIPCALSPTRSSVCFDKEKRRVFAMAGAACNEADSDKALIYEWDFDSEEEVNRYEISDGFFKAYPFEVVGGGLEERLEVDRNYRKGHLPHPVKCGELPSQVQHLDIILKKEMAFCYMDDLVLIRARDHRVEKVYLVGSNGTWERDFTDTVQKTEVFASKVYYLAVTTENLPPGRYELFLQCGGEMYDTEKYFVIGG